MPTLNDTLEKTTDIATETVATTAPVVEAVVVSKKKAKKEVAETKPEKTETTVVAEIEKKFQRPPLEILTQDFETFLTTLSVNSTPLKRLGYKCGKVIYGITKQNSDGSKAKDFRVIAFKARKKSKSVNGKSRCIFYFGLNQAKAKEIVKEHPEVKISTFGKCSVQSHSPVELILDRTTYTEKFGKDINKVTKLMNVLVAAAVECKTEQYSELKAKATAAEEKTTGKKKKSEKKAD